LALASQNAAILFFLALLLDLSTDRHLIALDADIEVFLAHAGDVGLDAVARVVFGQIDPDLGYALKLIHAPWPHHAAQGVLERVDGKGIDRKQFVHDSHPSLGRFSSG
jgi:hypothetical protein